MSREHLGKELPWPRGEERRAPVAAVSALALVPRAETLLNSLRSGRGPAAVLDAGPLPDWARQLLLGAISHWNDAAEIPPGEPPPGDVEAARLLGRLLCEAAHIQSVLQAADPRVERLILVLDPQGLLPLTVSRGGVRFGKPRDSDAPLVLRGHPATLLQVLSSHSSRHLLWAGATETISVEGPIVGLAILCSLLQLGHV